MQLLAFLLVKMDIDLFHYLLAFFFAPIILTNMKFAPLIKARIFHLSNLNNITLKSNRINVVCFDTFFPLFFSLTVFFFFLLEERELFASDHQNGIVNMTQRYLTGHDVLLDRRANKVNDFLCFVKFERHVVLI